MKTKARLLNLKRYDAFEELEDDASKYVEAEASKTIKSVTNLSNLLFSTESVPLIKNDLEGWLNSDCFVLRARESL